MHLENDLQLGIVGAKDLEEEREEADVTVGVHVPQLRVRQRHPNFILNTKIFTESVVSVGDP